MKRLEVAKMALKVIQGHPNCRYLIGHYYHFLWVV